MPTPEIDALLFASTPGWNGENGAPATVTYSFADDPNRPFGVVLPDSEWEPFTEVQKSGIRTALSAWADASGLAFVEVPDNFAMRDTINIRFHLEVVDGGDGFAGYPPGGWVYLNQGALIGSDFAPGSYGFTVAIHEIGHAIGLKHPFEGAVQLPAAVNNSAYTVMSYNVAGPVTGIGIYDRLAAQYIYGPDNLANGSAVALSWDTTWSAVRHTGTAANERIYGSNQDDIIVGAAGNDVLDGREGSDWLFGGDGDDTIRGTLSWFDQDSIYGREGFDWLVLPDAASHGPLYIDVGFSYYDGGVVRENAGFGATYNRFVEIEGIVGTRHDDIFAGGRNWPSDVTFRFVGGGGNDRILGAGRLYNQADYRGSTAGIVARLDVGTTTDGLGGTDTLDDVRNIAGSARFADRITGSDSFDRLYGEGGNDTLAGGLGGDTLDGGTGADSLVGGAGDDVHHVDSAGDRVLEVAGGGRDRVISTAAINLFAEVEDLILGGARAINANGNALANAMTGNAAANLLNGGLGDDTLAGAGGIDTLQGGGGNDRLDGGLGADSMAGGLGNDTFIVDNAGDAATEAAGAGTDIVLASVAHTLAANVEALTLTGIALLGTGNALNNTLTGNGAANTLSGLSGSDSLLGLTGNDTLDGGIGNDTLDGGLGVDSLAGGAGNDTYFVNTSLDRVVELAGGGVDRVISAASLILYAEVENLTLAGTTALVANGNALNNAMTGNSAANQVNGGLGNDTLDGADGADTLLGGDGNDSLVGGAGDDTLVGGLGIDTPVGGAGADHFRFVSPNPGYDRIADFAAEDVIEISRAGFGNLLPLAALEASRFSGTGVAVGTMAQFVYVPGTGTLRWDADGAGGDAAVTIAVLTGAPALTAADMVVIA
jgi:Ca2+-binding RTX toxin-like protein